MYLFLNFLMLPHFEIAAGFVIETSQHASLTTGKCISQSDTLSKNSLKATYLQGNFVTPVNSISTSHSYPILEMLLSPF